MKKYEKVFKVINRQKGIAKSAIVSLLGKETRRECLSYSVKRFTEKRFTDMDSDVNLGIFCFRDLEAAKDFKNSNFSDIELEKIEIFQALAVNPREVSNYTDKNFPKGTMLTEKLKLVKRFL